MGRLKARLASRNPGKLRELRPLLPRWELDLLEADTYPAEDGATYYDNARIKAHFGRTGAEPDAWILGEDSGIEVDRLGGGPGIHSARAGGDDPVAWLMNELDGVHGDGRYARYVCELVCLSPAGEELRGTGTLEGRIACAPRGSEGFGYDPVFVPDRENRTVAELGNAWKVGNSHRARAAQALLRSLGEPR